MPTALSVPLVALLCALAPAPSAPAFTPAVPSPALLPAGDGVHLSQFGAGDGPRAAGSTYHLLDAAHTPEQSNAVAFDAEFEGAREQLSVRARLRVLEGGEGGALVLLDTGEYGVRGPAPFVPLWTEPNLRRSFAVGVDVHDPPNDEPFGPWGNVVGAPEREVSLHWDGRELVKRVAPVEFRGDWADLELDVRFVCGGAEVSVRLGEAPVYERWFVAGMLPYEARLAVGAGTRADASTEFDVADLVLEPGAPATPRRPPLHVDVFHHVLTDNSKTAFEAEVDLPPADWAFGRVLLTLDIHDAGAAWDEWDRNGDISIWDAQGEQHVIVPFITSYRTQCHWVVDVTAFRPYLADRTRFEIRAGTTFYKNRGYEMSVALDYHHALPADEAVALEPYRIAPLWSGTAHYRSAENHFADFFEPRQLAIGAETRVARVFVTTTGHSQVGEFTPSERALVFVPDVGDAPADTEVDLATDAALADATGDAPADANHDADADAVRFENTLWKSDCYLNPNRPQFGTWKYSRAGWAPGDVVAPWWIDLTPHLSPGRTAELRYEPQPYEFPAGEGEEAPPGEGEINAASHVVRAYLVEYREATDVVPAPILRVVNVAGDSNAARAGIEVGDYLASYDGVLVDSTEQLGEAKAAAAAAGKQRVTALVFRGNERLELELDVGQLGVNLAAR